MKATNVLIISLAFFIIACSKTEKGVKSIFKNESFEQKVYEKEKLERIAFPIGGIGAGMFCVNGNGSFSSFSIRNKPDIFNEPVIFSAIHIKNEKVTKIIEGEVPVWKLQSIDREKLFSGAGNGKPENHYGLPRFEKVTFTSKFPFAELNFQDKKIPFDVKLVAWSPFIPNDADNSSLPVGCLEYTFTNKTNKKIDAIYSFNSKNFLRVDNQKDFGVKKYQNGFILFQNCRPENPEYQTEFSVFTDEPNTVTDLCWFRGGWFDPLTMIWKKLSEGDLTPVEEKENAPGASLFVPFSLSPNESKTIKIFVTWYSPNSNTRYGQNPKTILTDKEAKEQCKPKIEQYEPWYAGKFASIIELNKYFSENFNDLKSKTQLFTKTFYESTLPAVILEAVAANLTILKSPTVLRQKDGRLWGWEGCFDRGGCCAGSCTHVWNYAQSIPHLFPQLERTLRETEFFVSQNDSGHQTFRSYLPIREPLHNFHAAADGQLGGIMKAYREWRISGDNEWIKRLYPKLKQSVDYCINTWDPRHKGVLEEPHHNTYDIEFWGPNGMCSSFYHGALKAIIEIGTFLKEDVSLYKELLEKGKAYIEKELFNGEYFIQKIQVEGLNAGNPVEFAKKSFLEYSEEAQELLKKEGPKYQYGNGCLSDGVLGYWMAKVCGLGDIIDEKKVTSHLMSVYKYNFKTDLSEHVNPQRPAYACGKEGGLLLCTWPKGDMLSLPFVYSNEVWTGIEYQVASHLFMQGKIKEGLDIVKACRDRYDGYKRNPFDEIECGHWYARAMSSYALLQGLSGLRYDAVDKKLYVSKQLGDDFKVFISTATGYGLAGMKKGKPFIDVVSGKIEVKEFVVL